MTKKNVFLVLLTAVLAGVYVFFFTDWFATENIQIVHTVRPAPMTQPRKRERVDFAEKNYANTVSFAFDRKYRLSSVRVYPLSDIETNKYPHAIWHLVSETNSAPVQSIVYGKAVPGMKSALKDSLPDPLLPNVAYRLIVEAGSVKGQHDFKATAKK